MLIPLDFLEVSIGGLDVDYPRWCTEDERLANAVPVLTPNSGEGLRPSAGEGKCIKICQEMAALDANRVHNETNWKLLRGRLSPSRRTGTA